MTVSEFTVKQQWQSDRSSPARWIFSHTLRHGWIIAAMLVGALGNALLASIQPLQTGRAFDAILATPPDLRTLGNAALLIAIIEMGRGLALQMARNFAAETLGQRLERDIRDELYASLIGKSMGFHDAHPTGDLMARATNDVREINMMFNPGLNMVIGSANFLLMPLIVAPTLHPQLLLSPVIYLIAYAVVVSTYLRQLRPVSEAVRAEFGQVNTVLAEAIEGVETVKAASQETYEIGRFRRALTRWTRAYVGQADIEACDEQPGKKVDECVEKLAESPKGGRSIRLVCGDQGYPDHPDAAELLFCVKSLNKAAIFIALRERWIGGDHGHLVSFRRKAFGQLVHDL